MKTPPASHLVLRDLPLPARLTLAAFLISVGIGYCSALVQLHFQHASPGNLLPSPDDAVKRFSGSTGPRPLSKIELLLEADEQEKFNGSGQMSGSFTTRSEGWKKALKARGEKELRAERDTERLAVLAWIRAGASKRDFEKNLYPLPQELADRPMTEEYLVKEEGTPEGARAVKLQSLLQDRCFRCHAPDGEDGQAAQYPLNSYDKLKPYVTVQAGSSAMSLTKLAQTTHVHLLGFAMLYGLTGLILAFSSYPAVVRLLLCPLPLVAQVADISFWWLARLDAVGPHFARAIVVSGAVVAGGLMLHIVLSLFDLFGRVGKVVVVLLVAGGLFAAFEAKQHVIDPFITQEAAKTAEVK